MKDFFGHQALQFWGSFGFPGSKSTYHVPKEFGYIRVQIYNIYM